jgi:hypothetical protein
MTKSRASIFEEPADLDVAAFAPKTAIDAKAPAAEQVRAVSEAARFRSRQPTPAKPESGTQRARRQFSAGRNVQFSAKASPETVNAIYAITDAHPGWVLGYTLQRAIEALQRELKSAK